MFYGPALQAAVQAGQVSMATLNGMVSRILTEMFKFNEFNNPPTGTTSATVTTAAHQAVSDLGRRGGHGAAEEHRRHPAAVRERSGGSVAVIGPAASAAPTDTGGGSAYVTSTFNVTPLQGIQAAAGTGTTVNYVQGLPTDTSLSAIPSTDLTPAYQATNYGAELHRHADRPGDRHLRAGVQEPGLLHRDQPVPGRQGDPRQPGHPAGLHLLGRAWT